MLPASCVVYNQDRWVFCTSMFIGGFAVCMVLFLIAIGLLHRPLTRRGLAFQDTEDIAIRLVSLLHALWVSLPFTYALATESLPTAFSSHYRCATFILSSSMGYFLFDMVALTHSGYAKGHSWRARLTTMVHHVFSVAGEYCTLVAHSCGFLVALLMLSEYTTPLLHCLYVMEKLNALGNKQLMTILMCGLLLVMWVIFRLGVSAMFVLYLVQHFEEFRLEVSGFNQGVYLFATVFFNLINAFWFVKLLHKGKRTMRKLSQHPKTKST